MSKGGTKSQKNTALNNHLPVHAISQDLLVVFITRSIVEY